MRRALAGLSALSLLVGGYLTADIYDIPGVTGVLTLEQAPRTAAGMPPGGAAAQGAVPLGPLAAGPIVAAADESAPTPARARLASALAGPLADPGLGLSVGVTVRDASTGEHLLDVSALKPRTPASTAKLFAATAIVSELEPAQTFSTRAVRGASASDVILVAGGDTLLSPGKGDPLAVAGRAGLAELADQTARALKVDGVTSVSLHIDEGYASGAKYAPGWLAADISGGSTGPVAMLGLSTQRPVPGKPASTDPALSTARAFSGALAVHGVRVSPTIDRVQAPKAAPTLGAVRSAPLADVLALALDTSDNALTESLTRQAALHAGQRTSFAGVAAWVKKTVASKGVAMDGVTLVDTSGLTRGSLIPVRAIGDLLSLAASGQEPALQDVVSRLPVAGLTGTLADRFQKAPARAAAGIARAKTGTLTGTAGLAGTVVDRDGRLLTFAILADKIPPGAGTLAGRAALDRFVARLATCGCG